MQEHYERLTAGGIAVVKATGESVRVLASYPGITHIRRAGGAEDYLLPEELEPQRPEADKA